MDEYKQEINNTNINKLADEIRCPEKEISFTESMEKLFEYIDEASEIFEKC